MSQIDTTNSDGNNGHKGNGHKLTTKQKRLLEVLSNDNNVSLKHTELARKAGMSTSNFYSTLRSPKFIVALKDARSYVLKTALLKTTKMVVKDANDPLYAKRATAQNLYFEQAGLKQPDRSAKG